MMNGGGALSAILLSNGAKFIGLPKLEGQLYLSIGIIAIMIVVVTIYELKKYRMGIRIKGEKE
jgi:hypothetical protein